MITPPPLKASLEEFVWKEWFNRVFDTLKGNANSTVVSSATDPSNTNISAGEWAIYKNTSTGTVKLWTNDGGTMKSVTLT